MKYKRIFFFLLFHFVLINIYSIQPSIRNFSRKTCKAGTQNWKIIQHKNDWMYFANNSGLLEFDGNRWTVYPIKNYTNVRSLFYDNQNDRIYAGAFNEFGFYDRNKNGLLKYTSLINLLKPVDRNFTEIWNINKIENAIYFQGDKEIFCYKSGKITKFTFRKKIDLSAVIQNSLLIANSEDGVSILNGSFFMKLPNSEILKNKKICSILPFQGSKILFVTEFNGLFVFDGNKVDRLSTDIDSFLAENQVFCATIEGSKVAFGTVRKGLVLKDFSTNSTFFSNTFSGMQNNTILSIAFDRQHNLWLGLDKGIDYVLVNSPIYDLFGNSQLYGAGYTSLIKNNLLYLGTNQGLYFTSFPIINSPFPPSISIIQNMQGQVWSLSLIDNTIFCGSDHGAFIISGTKASKISGVQGTWGFREIKNETNFLLGCSYQGFFILKKTAGSWKFSNFVTGFYDSGGNFEIDNDGYIWFCHWIKGISRLKISPDFQRFVEVKSFGLSKGIVSNRDNTIASINNKIVISADNGFFEYNNKKDSMVRCPEIHKIFGIPGHSAKLNSSNNGDIWCTSFSAINVAFKQHDNSYKIDTISFSTLKNKIISGFVNYNFINEKNIIVSTEDGFSWLDLSRINPEKSNFKISIRNIYLTGENDSVVGGYDSISEELTHEFSFSHNSVKFEFVAPEFRNDGSVQYSYLLENYDSKWSSFSSVNVKEYTKLKKGSYIFRVKAKSIFEPNNVETSYSFSILPPWYESKVAYLIYLLLFAYFIYRLSEFIKKRSEKGAREMEAQKELELKEQEKRFEEDAKEKRKEIIELKNQRLQYDLRHKSQELANSTMNLIRKNEILLDISQKLDKVISNVNQKAEVNNILKEISKMQIDIKHNIEHDNNWKKFAENFDLVYENYLKRLSEKFPQLTVSDKKLCAYLKMDLTSKDIAPLLNMSYRSVEMSRYRLRKKMNLDRDVNLADFLQNF